MQVLETVNTTPVAISHYNELTQPLSLRILLAEDCPINRAICLLMLEEMGYGADVVSNGLEVLHALQERDYDIILMDVWMPVMDGITTTDIILNTSSAHSLTTQRPRIIAMTVNNRQEWYQTYFAVGIDDCLIKPLQSQQLKMMLEKWGKSAI